MYYRASFNKESRKIEEEEKHQLFIVLIAYD